jgi:hypothetical protein
MAQSVFSRVTALIVAATALAGDLLLLRDTVNREHAGWIHGIWTDGMFFSDLSNLLVATVFTSIAMKLLKRHRPWWLGLTLVCITLTAIGANGWRGVMHPLTGNTVVHTWVPLAVATWCLLFTTEGRLRWVYLPSWSLIPICYLVYALGRGKLTKVYPYRWLDPARVGVQSVALNAGIQVGTYIVLAAVLLTADRMWSRRRGDGPYIGEAQGIANQSS